MMMKISHLCLSASSKKQQPTTISNISSDFGNAIIFPINELRFLSNSYIRETKPFYVLEPPKPKRQIIKLKKLNHFQIYFNEF